MACKPSRAKIAILNHNKECSVEKKKKMKILLTARTRKGITSIMIRVDLTPIALKKPTDPSTDNMTSTTPERPSNT